jgi:peptide-methionine (R)-S-oxide reductase
MSTPPADQTRDDDLRARLTPLQYEVTQRQATERAFTGEYWDCHDDGTYHCVVCDEPLFSSDTKYESGSGWPSFFEPVHEGAIETRRDTSHGMVRDEIVCATCGAHVGHVFPDGPKPTGERYCTNSASLRLANDTEANDTEADGASADG